jgi:CheY-like chemotaxis protein
MLAHELRNPLAPIRAAAQLLQLPAVDGKRILHTSQIIARQVAHMTNLVDELLDVSRISKNLVKLDSAPLDIRQVVRDAVEQVTPLIQGLRHDLEVRVCPEIAFVLGDKDRLVQTFANLLNNAAKFTPAGGKLALKVEALEEQVCISVIDNGIGMTPDTVAHAFELFSQAERSADRSAGGLGLGLALVKSMVELHGGTVSCDSAGLGKGSRFSVRLPRLLLRESVEEPGSQQASTPGQSRSLRIMVVDDNEDAGNMLAMLLETMGHEVVVEHGSKQALERAGSVSPQVFLLDIGLPDMDGNELARHLRARAENTKAVLIAVTGYGQESDRNRSLDSGFDYHLVKPVDIEKLSCILSGIHH